MNIKQPAKILRDKPRNGINKGGTFEVFELFENFDAECYEVCEATDDPTRVATFSRNECGFLRNVCIEQVDTMNDLARIIRALDEIQVGALYDRYDY